MSQRIDVNPELLYWALARAGLDADALAGRFPKLGKWLGGELAPTLKQLESFATATHTAIGLLFLPKPPEEALPISNFRTMPKTWPSRPSANLLDTIYLCQQRQAWYGEYQRIQSAVPLGFVGSSTVDDAIVDVARNIAQTIGFGSAERQQPRNWTEALRHFIAQVEQASVLVMVSGVVGSNARRPLDPREFRGFALADPFAPLIFINGKDTKAAQMFTLAHELAHVWLGESGISNVQAATQTDETVERWCNTVAAELLVPLEQIRDSYSVDESIDDAMQRLARQFKVSTLVILRRLHDLGAIDRETLWDIYRKELERLKALSRTTGSGGDFYNSLGARVSKRFARALISSTLEGQTQFTEAFRMLGVRNSATFYEEAKRMGLHR